MGILEQLKLIKSVIHKSVLHPLKIPRPNKGTTKLCGFFVDHPCKFSSFLNSLSKFRTL